MRAGDHLPTITQYSIRGAAGNQSRRGLAHHDVQATAWAALEAVTATRWDRLELRQRRAGVFELEGFIGGTERSGVYMLRLDEPGSAPSSGLTDSGPEDLQEPARPSTRRRESWADWIPGAPATLTQAELVDSVACESISAVAIAQWEREGILPLPLGPRATAQYPREAGEVLLLLVSLAQAGRAHLDILEVLRNTARSLHTEPAPVDAHPTGG